MKTGRLSRAEWHYIEENAEKMTPEEIKQAHVLIDDYKSWIYPFR